MSIKVSFGKHHLLTCDNQISTKCLSYIRLRFSGGKCCDKVMHDCCVGNQSKYWVSMDRKPPIQIDQPSAGIHKDKSELRTYRYNVSLQIYCYKVPYIRINHEIKIRFRYQLGPKPPILLVVYSWPTKPWLKWGCRALTLSINKSFEDNFSLYASLLGLFRLSARS